MIITSKVNMNLKQRTPLDAIEAVQDDRYSRNLEISLYAGDIPMNIPEDTQVRIRYSKADGKGGEYDTLPDGAAAWSAEGNVLTVALAPQVLTVPGPVTLAVRLIREEKQLSTFSILLNVHPAVNREVTESDDYYRVAAFLPAPGSAKAGQYFRIAAVDEQGKVTAVEAVNPEGGGSGGAADPAAVQQIVEEYLEENPPAPGADGKDGSDGVSVTHRWNGTVLEVTSASGTSAADLKGEKGEKGDTGPQGGKGEKGDKGDKGDTGATGAAGAAGKDGSNGADGVSPTVSVNKSGKVTTISITDKNGTKTATIHDGADGSSAGSDYTIPDYWKTVVDNAVAKVRALQDAGGRDTVNFVYFSDLHYGDNTDKIQYLGHLCAAIMDKCNIPLVINCGDTMVSSPLASESALLENLDNGTNLLSPIPEEGYAQIFGNHDDVWGQNNGISYVNKVAPEKIWNRMFRKQAKDLHRVFGGNGTYFYIDNVPQQVRFVCLNSHYYDGEAITNGTTRIMTIGFGTKQLEWLKTTALNVEDGWSVVIATHVPPTAKTINGNTHYLSQLSDGAAFRTIINETSAKLIGIFCGHCHASAIVTDDLPCPVVTVTTAGGVPYDSTEGTRTAGTTTETALDIVSINKAEEKIYLTRLGIGTDRVCSYAGAEVVTYSITNTLTNVTNGNTASVIESGKSYSATLTATSGYELSTVKVTMGGTDVTASVYSNGVMNIASVTGNVVITASATKIVAVPSYTNLADPSSADWSNDDRLSSSGTPKGAGSCTGSVVTNWIDVVKDDVIRVKGIDLYDTTAGYCVGLQTDGTYDSPKPSQYQTGFTKDENGVFSFTNWLLAPTGTNYGDTHIKMRFSGPLTVASASEVIITRNEEIV